MIVFSHALFVLMGLSLGLVGAGGAILTIPILIYFFHIPPLLATTYSLFIVGSTTLLGAWQHRGNIDYWHGLWFGVPSMLGVFAARYFVVPLLPPTLFNIDIEKIFLTVFILILFIAAMAMMRPQKMQATKTNSTLSHLFNICITAIGFGMLMGLLGIGGGFLLVPALVLLVGVHMKSAIATSLFLIMLNSATGFLSDRHHLVLVDYQQLVVFAALGFVGIWVGSHYSHRVHPDKLKKGFGVFIALIAILMAVREFVI